MRGLQISENSFVCIIAIICGSLVVAWFIALIVLKQNTKDLIKGGSVLKIIAAVIIVVSASLLALIDKVNGEAAITLMSGVAGYILGTQASGLRRNRSINKDNNTNTI